MPRQHTLLPDDLEEEGPIRGEDRYSVIYADPPWTYKDKANAGKRGAVHQYPVMELDDIKALPVGDIAADNSALFLWVTAPLLPTCLEVVIAWGFKYKTIGFTWVKTYPESEKYFMGMGNYTRSNAEFCLLAFKGEVLRVLSKSVRSLVVTPLGRHSEKPSVVRERIVELFGDIPRIELFARQRVAGWDAWGNHLQHSDLKLVGNRFITSRQP
jgi:site-specific DNA-methyltransferase (adenine-specific)